MELPVTSDCSVISDSNKGMASSSNRSALTDLPLLNRATACAIVLGFSNCQMSAAASASTTFEREREFGRLSAKSPSAAPISRRSSSVSSLTGCSTVPAGRTKISVSSISLVWGRLRPGQSMGRSPGLHIDTSQPQPIHRKALRRNPAAGRSLGEQKCSSQPVANPQPPAFALEPGNRMFFHGRIDPPGEQPLACELGRERNTVCRASLQLLQNARAGFLQIGEFPEIHHYLVRPICKK